MGPPIPGYPRGNKDPRIAPESEPPIRPKQRTLNDEDKETVKAFHAGGGKVGITIGTNALIAVITAGLTWLTTHHEATPADCASRADVADVQRGLSEVKQGLAQFIEKYQNDSSMAHNDSELLKLRIENLATRIQK